MHWALAASLATTRWVLALIASPSLVVALAHQPVFDNNRRHICQKLVGTARHASVGFGSRFFFSAAVIATNETASALDAGNHLLRLPVVQQGLQEVILRKLGALAITVAKFAVTLHHLGILSCV